MTTLGKYELHEQLGRGGFGTVYRATDTTLGREVALKVLHPQLTTDPDFLERFRNEARLVASLDSPNIVTIYELGETEGRVFIAMKYLPGGSLKERLEKNGALPFDEVVKIMNEVCTGLAVAHKKGLVHRDIKPGNILFDSEGHAVLGDFGLARAIQQSSLSAASSSGGVGTPAYRAPELWRGKPPASPATDIYSLGCVLSEMLTGKMLFDGNTPDEILAQHLIDGPNLPVTYPFGVPKSILSVVEKSISKDPQKRYQTVKEFEKGLTVINTEIVDKRSEPDQPETGSKGYQESAQTNKNIHTPPLAPVTDNLRQKQKPNLSNLWLGVAGVIIVGLVITLIITTKKDPSTMAAMEMPTNTDIPIATQVQQPEATSIPEETSPAITIGSSQVSTIDGMTMMYVPAGNFLMGSPDGVGRDDEHPQHTVYLDAYWIDQTEVTNAMYEKCVAAGVCTVPHDLSSHTRTLYYGNFIYDNYPVVYLDWNQANTYCNWAGRSLPTEAQWEKAARGTNGWIYPWGNNDPNNNLVNYHSDDTNQVGNYSAGTSPFELLDMAGNAREWVADWYDEKYYSNSPTENPTGPDHGTYRILRGGSWDSDLDEIRTTSRYSNFPKSTGSDYSFRCSLSMNQEDINIKLNAPKYGQN